MKSPRYAAEQVAFGLRIWKRPVHYANLGYSTAPAISPLGDGPVGAPGAL